MSSETQNDALSSRHSAHFNIRFPEIDSQLDQDEECFEFVNEGNSRRLRIQDYSELYKVPGLYEALVYGVLKCRSPQRLATLFKSVLADSPQEACDLRVLDLGAGNGIVAEELRKLGVRHTIGLDILPEARAAAQRDRDSVYRDYFVLDLAEAEPDELERIEEHRLNCLVSVAALGYGDIQPEAFAVAYNLLKPSSWIAMTIKEDFLRPGDGSGFAQLLQRLISDGVIRVQAHQRYCHRLATSGQRLYYIALVATKTEDISDSLLKEVGEGPEASTKEKPSLALGVVEA